MLGELQHTEKFWSGLQHLRSRGCCCRSTRSRSSRQERAAGFAAFIAAAQQHGVAVELLLGEPTWIEPSMRQPRHPGQEPCRLKFAGLHLDIEPHQLYKKEPLTRTQFDNWVDTLHAAAAHRRADRGRRAPALLH